MFYFKVKDLEARSNLIEYLKQNDIYSVFYYIPLHSAPAGLKFGRFNDVDEFTTLESQRLLRLPMYYGLGDEDVSRVYEVICRFFDK